MKFKDFTLDKFQEDAIEAIEKNNSVVVSAPTGSGKTLIADYIIDKHRNDQKRIIYTAPIKALSNQKYKDFSEEYGADKVGLMTGDIVINPQAKVLIMTTEIYRNMVISKDSDIKNIAYVIFDEIHYINDIERGYVWEESIIYSEETVRFLCLQQPSPMRMNLADGFRPSKIMMLKRSPRQNEMFRCSICSTIMNLVLPPWTKLKLRWKHRNIVILSEKSGSRKKKFPSQTISSLFRN